MDLDETDLDPSSIDKLSHQTTDWPLNSSTTDTVDIRAKRKSLRVRPPHIVENAEPLSPLNFSFQSAAPPTASKMSLFHIFSKPKVERQRGYAEKGVDITRQPQPTKPAAASTPNPVVHAQPPAISESRAQFRAQVRAQTPASLQADRSTPMPTARVKWKEPPPRDPERRNGVFEPPPLFQAYPQSVKDGTLEVSDMSPEAVLHKAKGKRSKADMDALGDAQSYKTRKSTKSSFKHVGHGASINVELPRKILVLVTSGYLLQYSETGPSDRLPERLLQLGKESAAFACDLLPGKHHVLQVSQAVDHNGAIVASSGSIFSKFGIRSAAAKRMTNGFLLVMPNGKEMESWMSAFRQEIEHLGGKKIPSDTEVRPKTGDNGTELKKTPSQSHRYQVKRNPSKVTSVTSPATSSTNLTTTNLTVETTIKLPSPTQSGFLIPSPTISAFQVPSPSRSPKIEEDKADDSDTATIDGIDLEASKLKEEEPEAATRNRTTSDAPSIGSSAVASVEHQQLNNVRNSFSNSTRTSHTSQAGTVVTANGTSRTNSLVGSPPSPGFLTGSLEAAREHPAPLKAPYRPMASAGYSLNRRRSAVPLPNQQSSPVVPALNTSPAKPRQSVIAESTVGGQQFPSPPRSRSPKRRLSAAQSEPNLKGSASTAEKHDSKISTPPTIPPTDDERPESFVGDLPPPSTWSSTRAPTRRSSLMYTPPPPTRSPPAQPQPDPPRVAEPTRPNKRISFSMPLKVNPQVPTSVTPPTNNRRRSQLGTPEPAGEQPVVHTLTAIVDSNNRNSFSQFKSSPSLALPAPNGGTIIPKRASVSQFHTSTSLPNQTRQRSSSGSPGPRLSLFPNPIALPVNAPSEPPQRSPSATTQTQTGSTQALRRPTSMQVRSDHAPFLQSFRNSTGPLDGRAVPIRGMKPSRSPSPLPAHSTPPNMSSFSGLKFDTPTLSEESDEATPLPERAVSPLPPPRPGSRSSGRKGSRRSSALPELDLGIPVVGLGPPAPPPSAPLPAPPPASRTTSPAPVDGANGDSIPRIDTVAGLGIRVS